MSHIKPVQYQPMAASNCVLMGIFAPNFGAAIIQRTGWQETTKHLHGSLPKYWYQRKLTVSGSKEVFEEEENDTL